MNELALFAGAGGGLLATHHLLGWRCVGYVEMAEYPCNVLEARINDGLLSRAPIYQMHTGDFIRFGLAEKYRGVAQVITAGFPCQPFSGAGLKLADKDPRNGWPDTIRIIRLVRPQYVLLENVSRLVSSPYFGTILSDLAQSGYNCRWDCIPADAAGAYHERDRLWVVAYSDSTEWGPCSQPGCNLEGHDNGIQTGREEAAGGAGIGGKEMADSQVSRNGRLSVRPRGQREKTANINGNGKKVAYPNGHNGIGRSGALQMGRLWVQGEAQNNGVIRRTEWGAEPELGRVAHGVAHRVDRLKAIGNGQVPAVVKEVWRILAK